jgi:hypothetical protein
MIALMSAIETSAIAPATPARMVTSRFAAFDPALPTTWIDSEQVRGNY